MKTISQLMSLTLFLSISSMSHAQDWIDQLIKKDIIEVRKTFSGSTEDKTSPASFSFFNSSEESDAYNIDLGVKRKWNLGSGTQLNETNIALAFEYHRNTSEASAITNKRSISIKFDQAFDILKTENNHNQSLFYNLSYALDRDSENHSTTHNYQVLSGLYLPDIPFMPGSDIGISKEGETYFRYMISAGYLKKDDFSIDEGIGDSKIVIAEKQDEDFFETNITADTFIFPDTFHGALALTIGYKKLDIIGSSNYLGENLENYSASLHYFIGDSRLISIGIDYENGISQTNNFRELEKTSIGFMIKI